jgi:hypothetical protein
MKERNRRWVQRASERAPEVRAMRQGEPTRGQQQTNLQKDDLTRDRPDVERRAERDRGLVEGVEAPSEVAEAPRAGFAQTSTWQKIKSRFVDDPEGAVSEAEDLVRGAVEERVRLLKQGLDELRMREPGAGASATDALRTRLIRYQAYYEQVSGTIVH